MPLGKPLSNRGRAFSDVVVQIYEAALSQGIYICTLLHLANHAQIMKNTLSHTLVKGELDYYKQYGIQEHTDGRHVVLIIPKGMKSIVQNVCFPSLYTLEAT